MAEQHTEQNLEYSNMNEYTKNSRHFTYDREIPPVMAERRFSDDSPPSAAPSAGAAPAAAS